MLRAFNVFLTIMISFSVHAIQNSERIHQNGARFIQTSSQVEKASEVACLNNNSIRASTDKRAKSKRPRNAP